MKTDKKPKYYDLMEELRKAILDGRIKPGEKLPSENELSESHKVSRQTVRKALQILQTEGYVYAEHGRGTFCSEMLRHARPSHNIAVVMTYMTDYIFPRLIQGIDEVMSDNGYSIMLKHTNNSRAREAACLEELIKKDIDGLIIEPSKSQILCRNTKLYEALDEYNIPYVFIQGSYSQMKKKPHVVLDDCRGGFLATEYLISLGHRDIVGAFKADDSQGLSRHKGYVQALTKAGIPYDPDKVIWFYTEDRHSHPKEQLRQLIKGRDELFFDAIVAYNDMTALELMSVVEEAGLKCPDDISITGFDDSNLASSCKVPLTTLSHPKEQLGKMAAELLLKLIENKEISEEERIVVVEPELVIRDSCK